jgi:uncharacterized protein with von Willebrand factor type A (vWA) domain
MVGRPMPSPAMTDQSPPSGRLAENIVHFCRVLRTAGLPVGPGQVLKAIEAVRTIDLTDRRQFYWALHASLVDRRPSREIFDQAFHVFWRNPQILDRMMGMVLPALGPEAEQKPDQKELARRVADAMNPGKGQERESEEKPELDIQAEMTWSDRELLRGMDFESMSAEEMAQAKQAMARMTLPVAELPTRRFRGDPSGPRTDLRATIKRAVRAGGDLTLIQRKSRRYRPPPLVVLCDISGSMARYSRMLLHFLHALTNDRDRVHTFVFGTRLTNVTRYLRQKDVDVALDRIGEAVEDWSGGTRMGACIAEFNREWSRRVLGQNASVLLITDGLDRDAAEGLAPQMERLHKSCHRLVWLNPLLRWDGFQPRSMGARAMLPHVDEFRPVHNLASLAELAGALSRQPTRRREGTTEWLKRLPPSPTAMPS